MSGTKLIFWGFPLSHRLWGWNQLLIVAVTVRLGIYLKFSISLSRVGISFNHLCADFAEHALKHTTHYVTPLAVEKR